MLTTVPLPTFWSLGSGLGSQANVFNRKGSGTQFFNGKGGGVLVIGVAPCKLGR